LVHRNIIAHAERPPLFSTPSLLYMTPTNLTLECSRQKHPFHILDSSPFPFLVSIFLFTLLVPLTFYLHGVQLIGGLPRADMMHIGFLGLYLTAMS
jgi:hypothetical protein